MNHPAIAPKRKAPALRLVSTKELSRDHWLEVRKGGIGSSDAAAAVGLNPYQSQLELWMIKTGRDGGLPKIDPNDETSPMYWGTLLEPIVAAHYTRRTGNRVRKINAVLQHPDADKAWMLANIDREVVGASDVQILECKTAGEFGVRLWRDGVPEYVVCQVQHQLAVTGKVSADVCVLVCGQEIRVHRIERDDALIAGLIELERRFWQYVESDTPPPADGSDSADVALRCLYPTDGGQCLDLTDDRDYSSTFADLVMVREEITQRQLLEPQLKQKIQQRMGDASNAVFETGSVSWKRSKDSQALNMDALLLDQPDLPTRYSVTKYGSRRFLIST
ncbi:YqaJ viral recombinase family protein [Herminiimonas fonticola]|uniref:Putative phage-type endonuclease n=1 Tax=Herminiimonas fonticola TaxID=303380 RepID=A0A4R6G056_9BURK|nr:YqaJ viral recombinase family protein [Herminiimonas fonticola]RBA22900.1 putative phage-type endonuclease [Herminiimonas fonticola]TDN87676.1 putative phage-type endonuclease [Herminiimonas fonticola]